MREASVMTSLHELRAIEQQRIVDERTAFDRQRAVEAEAVRVAEQARIEAAAARERAEREERLRIEQARADAEREARMRIEATEAAERARLAARLEQERLQQEIELRRAEVAKKRPTWMVAVTVVALVAGAGFGVFAVDRMHQAEVAQDAKAHADADKAQARKQAADAVAKLDAMQRDLDELAGKVAQAQHALDIARTEAERKQAQALLDEANRRHKAIADAIQRAKDIQNHKDRVKPVTIDACGANNVLCPPH
jgi:hypothetical protein